MRWGRLFLIKLCPDTVIHESAEVYRAWEQVPDDRKWSDPVSTGWQELQTGCFRKPGIPVPTLQDKLMIIAHGSLTHVGVENSALESPGGQGFDANDLAIWLKQWGIGEIGLISFKCCYIGAGTFLEDFIRASVGKVRVGWVKGYKGPASTIERKWYEVPVLGGSTGKPYESIKREDDGLFGKAGVPLYGSDRFKIVPGHAAMDVPGSRYRVDDFREVGD